jgi:hypothetical protein
MPTCSLREHSARLTQDDSGWLLTYPIARHQYGSREVELVEVMIPLVAENYAGAQACDVDPEDHRAHRPFRRPRLPRGNRQLLQLAGSEFTAQRYSQILI